MVHCQANSSRTCLLYHVRDASVLWKSFVPFSVSGVDSRRWSGHCFSLVAWLPHRLHVTGDTAFLSLRVRVSVRAPSTRVLVCEWLKLMGKTQNWKCLNLVLSLDRFFKKTWMFSWTFLEFLLFPPKYCYLNFRGGVENHQMLVIL